MSTVLWCIAAFAAGQITALLAVAFCMGCAVNRKRDEKQIAFLEEPSTHISSQQKLDKLEEFLAQWAKKDKGETDD